MEIVSISDTIKYIMVHLVSWLYQGMPLIGCVFIIMLSKTLARRKIDSGQLPDIILIQECNIAKILWTKKTILS